MPSRRIRLLLGIALVQLVSAQQPAFELPVVQTHVTVEDQPVTIPVTGAISELSNHGDPTIFKLRLNADLAALAEHIPGVLRTELNQSNRCGERVSIEGATLTPAAPAALLNTSIHFEKWACAKAFGKEIAKKLIAGNGQVLVRLTPSIESNSVRLDSEVTFAQADGKLGDALRSGQFGDALREKIRASLQSAIQKGMSLQATLPAALRAVASFQSVQFTDSGGGRLSCSFLGEVRLSEPQMRALMEQMKSH